MSSVMSHPYFSAWNLFCFIAMGLTMSPAVFAVSFAPAEKDGDIFALHQNPVAPVTREFFLTK